ncbi:MAG TPA: dihydrofolate reductase family protein [Nitrospiria bacterium]|jgi:dihydrofolate reductase
MSEIIYYVATSLDGFIATPDGGVRWLSPFENTGEDYGYQRFYGSVDGLVMGSKTYEQVLAIGEWPYPHKPCWVFSKRSFKTQEPEVTIFSGEPCDFKEEIIKHGLLRVWLVGGGKLASSFRAERLITEYIISIIPIFLCGGISLFAPKGSLEKIKMVDPKFYPNGIVQLRYIKEDGL